MTHGLPQSYHLDESTLLLRCIVFFFFFFFFFYLFISFHVWTNLLKANIKAPDETLFDKKVKVGKDQEKAQSEKDCHSKNRGGKKPN